MRLRRAPLALLAASLACAACGESASERTSAPALGAVTPQGPVGPLPGGAQGDPVQNPYRDDSHARSEGRRYFVAMNCAGCHGEHGGGGMGPSLRDAVWLYGGEDGDVFDSIAQGRANGMPAWGTMMPAELIWQITAYVKSLRTPAEPSPPR